MVKRGKKRTHRSKSKRISHTRKNKKINKKWCSSSNSWCKYTAKNNCKKGVWKKKTRLGRASKKWCTSSKRWCRTNRKWCKKNK